MLDEELGEAWLAENDPAYKKSGYRGPVAETCIGGLDELETAHRQGGLYVEHGAIATRSCRVCLAVFAPREGKNDLCSELCRRKAVRDYKRDYMRDYMRQRRKAA